MSAGAKKPDGNRPAVHERLRRLLFLVPYVAKHPGVTVDQLATALNVTKEALLEELDLLAMVGRPPFQPDDFIDIYVDDDRVFVDLDQRFSAPPRLTIAEAAALKAAAELMRPAGSEALERALGKLEKVLPQGAKERFREMGQKLDLSLTAPTELGPVTRAIVERRELEFDYFSSGRGQTERRRVRPHELFSHRGQWYLSAFCTTREDDRLFRLDRLANLALTSRTFVAAPHRASAVPNPAGGAGEVQVRFHPKVARYVLERFGSDARPLEGGGVEVRVAGDSERWLTQWVLSFGGDAEVVAPAWARRAVANAAQATLNNP